MIRPDQLHMGVDACMHCRETKHSSKPELFVLYFLHTILGIENVVSTDKETIGKELDIYVPSKSFAIEWNGWYWHHDKLENDVDKWKRCKEKGIELLSIYDGMHCDKWLDDMEKPEFPPGALKYKPSLYERTYHRELKELCCQLCKKLTGKAVPENFDWTSVENHIEMVSGSEPTENDLRKAGICSDIV